MSSPDEILLWRAQLVEAETGIRLEAITGHTEAHIGYIGVINTIDVHDAVIFDLGGGSTELTLIRGRVAQKMASLPFGASASAAVWELKIVGLAIIFIYAFFKFAWAYRLFNYAAILLGAVQQAGITPAGQGFLQLGRRLGECRPGQQQGQQKGG